MGFKTIADDQNCMPHDPEPIITPNTSLALQYYLYIQRGKAMKISNTYRACPMFATEPLHLNPSWQARRIG